MEHLVARGNRVDERGRGGINSGEKGPNNGMHKQRWMNCPKTGNGVLQLEMSTFCLGILIILITPLSVNGNPHEPFKWVLYRWEDQKALKAVITPGAPSFTAYLCERIQTNPCLNELGFYFCPSSNPGKSYCNYPGHYYCGYWGCETIASDWSPGGGKDKFLQVGWGPFGCKPHDRDPMGGIVQNGNCKYLYINITQPQDPGWMLGKMWGARLYEPGKDRGGHIYIKKEVVPHDPLPIGPNPVLNERREPVTSPPETQPTNTPTVDLGTPEMIISTDQEPQDPLWNIMQTSYLALNSTRPDLTKDCWLCYNVRPP